MTTDHGQRPTLRLRTYVAACSTLLLAACGAGFEYSGDAGSGGGPGGPGRPGNPLAIPLAFSVNNETAFERTETIRASVPFPEGGYANLDNVVVSGHLTAWKVLQRWPDGTVRIGQAQFTDVLPPNTLRTYQVARDEAPLTGPFERNTWVAQMSGGLRIGAQVQDTFNVTYRAFAEGAGEVLESTPLVQTKRFRTYHQAIAGGGIGRDYLTSTFYVTEFRDMPVLLVDWILGNDYLGADVIPPGNTDPNLRPLGMIDVRSAGFLVQGVTAAVPYRVIQEAVGSPVDIGGGLVQYAVLPNSYLEDGQTRRYRFHLNYEHPAASPEDRDRWRSTVQAINTATLFPLATLETWQQTDGAGLLGGPITGPTDAAARAQGEFNSWNGANHFGPFGSRGDPLKTGTTGTPRNHPLSPELAHAIQANHHRSLLMLEQKAWAQAMRPYHLFGLQVSVEQNLLLWDGVPIYPGSRDLSGESLGRRALWATNPFAAYRTLTQTGGSRAHGWEHFDHEHWTTDLLFDYWTVSGDEWAKEELRQLGQSLKSLMRLTNFSTRFLQAVRAEGWTMQGFAQIYQATGDPSIKDYALRRAHEVVEVQRKKTHPSRVMGVQGNYPGTGYPTNNEFFMPWQHGAVLYGYLGAFRFFEDPLLLDIAEDVATTVEYSWVTNFQDTTFGFVPQGLRYYVPFTHNAVPVGPNHFDAPPVGARFGDSPLGGAHMFLIGGLYLLADWSPDAAVRQRALVHAQRLWSQSDNASRWDKWHFCVPLNRVP